MKASFNPTCDRYGHILTAATASPPVMALFAFPTAEKIARFRAAPRTGFSAGSSRERGQANPGGLNRRPVSGGSLQRELVNR
jgi:hypothetical protein